MGSYCGTSILAGMGSNLGTDDECGTERQYVISRILKSSLIIRTERAFEIVLKKLKDLLR